MSRPTTPTREFLSNLDSFLKKFKLTKENDKDQEILTLANLDSGRIRRFIVKKVDERSLFRRNSQKSQKDENENRSRKSSRNNSLKEKKNVKRRKVSASSFCSLKRFGSKQSLASVKSSLSTTSSKKKPRLPSFGSGKFKIGWGSSSSEESLNDVFEPELEMTAKDKEDDKDPGFTNEVLVKEEFEDDGGEQGREEREDTLNDMEATKREAGEDTGSLSSLESSEPASPRFNLKMSPVPKRSRNKKNDPTHSPVSFRSGYQSNRSSISSVRKGILKKTNSCTAINMEMANLSRSESPSENVHKTNSCESFDDDDDNEDTSRFVRAAAANHQRSFNRVKFILDSGRPDNITGDYDDIKIEKNNDKITKMMAEKSNASNGPSSSGFSRSGRKCLVFSAGLLIMTMAVILGSFFGSRKSGLPSKALASTASNIQFAVEGKFKILNENFAQHLYNYESSEFRKMSEALEDVLVKAIFFEEAANQANSTIKLKVIKYEKGSVISIFRIKWEQEPKLKISEIRKRIVKHLEKYGAFGEYKVDKSSFSLTELRDLCEGNQHPCSHYCFLSQDTLRFGCSCPDDLILFNSTHCISPKLTTTTMKNPVYIPGIINKVLKVSNATLFAVNQERVDKGQGHPSSGGKSHPEKEEEHAPESKETPVETPEVSAHAVVPKVTENKTLPEESKTNKTEQSIKTAAEVLEPVKETPAEFTAPGQDDQEESVTKDPEIKEEEILKKEQVPATKPDEPMNDAQVVETESSTGEPDEVVAEAVTESNLEQTAEVKPESSEDEDLKSYSEDVTESDVVIVTLDSQGVSVVEGSSEVPTEVVIAPLEDTVEAPPTKESVLETVIEAEKENASSEATATALSVDKAPTPKKQNESSSLSLSGTTQILPKPTSSSTTSAPETATAVPETLLTVDPNLNEVSQSKDKVLNKPSSIPKDYPTVKNETLSRSSPAVTIPTTLTTAKVTISVPEYVLSSAKPQILADANSDSVQTPLEDEAKVSSTSMLDTKDVAKDTAEAVFSPEPSSSTEASIPTTAAAVTSTHVSVQVSDNLTSTAVPVSVSSDLTKSPSLPVTDPASSASPQSATATSAIITTQSSTTVTPQSSPAANISLPSVSPPSSTSTTTTLITSAATAAPTTTTPTTSTTSTTATPSAESNTIKDVTEPNAVPLFASTPKEESSVTPSTATPSETPSVTPSAATPIVISSLTPSALPNLITPERHVVTVHGIPVQDVTQSTASSTPTTGDIPSVSIKPTSAVNELNNEAKKGDFINIGLISDVSHGLSGVPLQEGADEGNKELSVGGGESDAHGEQTGNVTQDMSAVTPGQMFKNATSSTTSTTPVPPCSEDEFQCQEGSCVKKVARCDSVFDCIDHSDEKECVENKCLDNYQCRWSGDCLPRKFVCDGIKHCTDGDDEEGCETWKCNSDEFRCGTGSGSTCISLNRKCDGHPDCFGRMDELNCTSECPKDKFMCPEGSCIPNLWKCDGASDCLNGEDELDCDCEGLDQWPCAVGGCVPTFKLCDGLRQCSDGSDEWGCLKIDNDTKQLQVRSSEGRWSAVCGDKWTAQWTDLVCEQLGFGESLSTEVRRVTGTVFTPRVRLSSDAPEISRMGRAPLQYFLTHGECPNDPLVHISCKMQECGQWNISEADVGLHSLHQKPPESWPSLGLLIQPESLEDSSLTTYTHSCAASVITPSWVLTSYSCLASRPYGFEAEKWALLSGEFSPKAGQGNTQLKYANKIIEYPGAKRLGNLWVGDAALLRLQTPLKFGPDIQPICLAEEVAHSHDNCVIASWRGTSKAQIAGEMNQTVQSLPVPNLTLNTCNTSYYIGQLTPNHTCASLLQDKYSACEGQEGAPLMCQTKNGRWRLHGLLSRIGNCATFNLPSVFTDVSTIYSWVLNTIGRPLHSEGETSIPSTTTLSSSSTASMPLPNAEAVLPEDAAQSLDSAADPHLVDKEPVPAQGSEVVHGASSVVQAAPSVSVSS